MGNCRAWLFGGISLFLVACGTETYDFDNDSEESRVEVKLGGQIVTRTIGNQWEDGDEVGIFMFWSGGTLSDNTLVDNAFNRKYIASTEGILSAATELDKLYYPQSDSVDFIAYYPFSAVEDYQLALDVSDQRFPAELDLLYSNNLTGVTPSVESQNLVFEHLLSKVIFTLVPGEGYTDADLQGATVLLRDVSATGSVSLVNSVIIPDLTLHSVSLPMTDLTAEGIMIPQECGDAQVVITLASGAKFLQLFSSGQEWASGKQYSYSITLSSGENTESVLEAEITNWLDGDTSGALSDYTVEPWNGTSISTSWYSPTEQTMSILAPDELAGLAKLVNDGVSFAGKTIVLMNDLNLNGHPWTPVGYQVIKPFDGTFLGNNHKISQVSPTLSGKYAALFGVSTGVIEDLVVDGDCTIASSDSAIIYVGGICGNNRGTLRNCRSYAQVSGGILLESDNQTNPYVGGLVGINEGTLENSQNYGTVTASNCNTGSKAYVHLGGIAGANMGTIRDCENIRLLTVTNGMVRAGGIAGLSTGTTALVEGCVNLGNLCVSASHLEASAGGIVGRQANGAHVQSSTNKGHVSITLASGTKVYGGGIVALSDSAFVDSSTNKGDVTVTCTSSESTSLTAAGGVVGYLAADGTVSGSDNDADIVVSGAAENYAGGICGFATDTTLIWDGCTNSGSPAQNLGNAE